MTPYKIEGTDLTINAHIQTNAKSDAIVGLHGDKLKIKINAPPVDGKANQHLIEFLSQFLKIPKRQIEIIRGEHSKDKLIKLHNVISNDNNIIDFIKQHLAISN
jgi:uncharacterized protein